jgi:hypothetical protein
VVRSIFNNGFALLETCGMVRWAEAVGSGFFSDVAATPSDRSLGLLGEGLKRSGWAISAERVSKGKNEAFGSPG